MDNLCIIHSERQHQREKLIIKSQNCSVIFSNFPPTTNKLRTIFKQHQLQLIKNTLGKQREH
jgi:hypothetical protein